MVRTPPSHGGNRGSNPRRVTSSGPLAQLAEHPTLNRQVEGSIPSWPTKIYLRRLPREVVFSVDVVFINCTGCFMMKRWYGLRSSK